MNKVYNLDNLEALFKKYLMAGINKSPINSDDAKITDKKVLKSISIKNYLSDLRHFLGWLIFYFQSHNQNNIFKFNQASLKDQFDAEIEVLRKIDPKIIEKYKTYLISNHLPIKTINRRLSTLRKFFSFCINQGWFKENPAKQVQNLRLKIKNDQLNLEKEKILTRFKIDLSKENISQEEVNSYLKDIKEFLSTI